MGLIFGFSFAFFQVIHPRRRRLVQAPPQERRLPKVFIIFAEPRDSIAPTIGATCLPPILDRTAPIGFRIRHVIRDERDSIAVTLGRLH
jgi:hypothetical protein